MNLRLIQIERYVCKKNSPFNKVRLFLENELENTAFCFRAVITGIYHLSNQFYKIVKDEFDRLEIHEIILIILALLTLL